MCFVKEAEEGKKNILSSTVVAAAAAAYVVSFMQMGPMTVVRCTTL